jgi:hypothetical protein
MGGERMMMALSDNDLAMIEQRLQTVGFADWYVQGGTVTDASHQTIAICPSNAMGNYADFIAHAPGDIQQLLAEVRRLRAGQP